MVEVRWRLAAARDLRSITFLIARERPVAAIRMADRIERLVSLLADQPLMGVSRPDLGPSLRSLAEKPYIVVYRAVPGSDKDVAVRRVDILRVVDGRRDLPRLFGRARVRR